MDNDTAEGTSMLEIEPKYIVDRQGRPQEVIISWAQFQQISEILGLDLNAEAVEDLRQGQRDRGEKNDSAYVGLDAIL